jgi:phosphoribosyl-AMP cyclohydrolase / phosphoribosyl-ATP pyrophosphohydrolase
MSNTPTPEPASEPRFGPDGLVPAIAQDASTGAVLTLAYMNREAWETTLRTRRATFWSRSRDQLWEKGATSGNTLHVRGIRLDCDSDAVLLLVDPAGPACHTGSTSCFFEEVATGDATG